MVAFSSSSYKRAWSSGYLAFSGFREWANGIWSRKKVLGIASGWATTTLYASEPWGLYKLVCGCCSYIPASFQANTWISVRYTQYYQFCPSGQGVLDPCVTSCSTPHQPGEGSLLVRFGSQGVLGLSFPIPIFSLPPSGLWALSLMTLINFPRLGNFLNKFYLEWAFFIQFFNWGIADLQCGANLCCTAKWQLHSDPVIPFHIFFSVMAYHRIFNTIPCPKH